MAEPLAINFGLTAAAMALLWLLALRLRDVSFIDAVWGGGMAGSTCRIDRPCVPEVHAYPLVGKTLAGTGPCQVASGLLEIHQANFRFRSMATETEISRA